MNAQTSFDGLQVDLDKAHDIIIVSNRTKYAYNPYCMRCPGLIRMREDKPFLWSHHCGAVHDETQVLLPEHVEVLDHQNGDCGIECPICNARASLCPGCKQPINVCPHGGDCLELQAIYREQQREQLRDIDVTELDDCMDCGNAVDKGYHLCYSCEHGLLEERER